MNTPQSAGQGETLIKKKQYGRDILAGILFIFSQYYLIASLYLPGYTTSRQATVNQFLGAVLFAVAICALFAILKWFRKEQNAPVPFRYWILLFWFSETVALALLDWFFPTHIQL